MNEVLPTDGRIESWPRSLEAWNRSKTVLGGGVSTGLRASMPPHPLCFESGEGSKLRDVDGNQYTDYVLGWGPVFLGHCHPGVTRAVQRQAELGETFGSGHKYEYEVARLIVDAIPGVERVLFSNTGTEANQSAVRLARAFTGRQRVLKFTGHYHGWHDQMLINYRGPGADRDDNPVMGTRGQSVAAMADVALATFNDLDSARRVLLDPDQDIAAVIIEPVLMNSGVLPAGQDFLVGLREVCDQTGTVLIFDQVITGFRLALGGAVDFFGVTPDLNTLAKGLANGYSVAAVAGTAEIIDQVTQGVVHAGTYNGNPIGLAAAHATLTNLTSEPPFERLTELARTLAAGFTTALASYGITGTAHSVGPVVQLALGVERLTCFSDYLKADWSLYDALLVAMLRRGQFGLPGGRWYLSAAHTERDVAQTVKAFELALGELATVELREPAKS